MSRDEVVPPSGPRATNVTALASLIIDLAAGFVGIDPERVDQAIGECLRGIVGALDLETSPEAPTLAFKDYPQRQKAASFNLDEVLQKLKEGSGSK